MKSVTILNILLCLTINQPSLADPPGAGVCSRRRGDAQAAPLRAPPLPAGGCGRTWQTPRCALRRLAVRPGRSQDRESR